MVKKQQITLLLVLYSYLPVNPETLDYVSMRSAHVEWGVELLAWFENPHFGRKNNLCKIYALTCGSNKSTLL